MSPRGALRQAQDAFEDAERSRSIFPDPSNNFILNITDFPIINVSQP